MSFGHQDKTNTTLSFLEKAVERSTGKSVDELRNTPLDEQRRKIEERTGRTFRFTTAFPFIGRGNVNRDRIVSGSDINKEIDRILSK